MREIQGAEIFIQADSYLPKSPYPSDWHFLNVSVGELQSFEKGLIAKGMKGYVPRFILKKWLFPALLKWRKSQILQYIDEKGIDIIHSHFGPNAIRNHPIAISSNRPHVISFYGFDYERAPFQNKKILKSYKKLFEEAALFVCEGSHGKKILEKYGCHSDKIEVVRLGLIPPKQFPSNKSKKAETLQLVQIANYSEKKGHVYTVEAFVKALEDCPNMHLTLVGSVHESREQWIKDHISSLIQKKSLESKVTFLDSIDFNRLYDFLGEFDVFIHPSVYAKNMDCEGGAPVVILDAQSRGIPVISSWHCDIPDEVLDGKTGLLADEKDVETLADHIKTFYEMESETFEKYSIAAIQHVAEHYNIQQSGKQLEMLYESLLN